MFLCLIKQKPCCFTRYTMRPLGGITTKNCIQLAISNKPWFFWVLGSCRVQCIFPCKFPRRHIKLSTILLLRLQISSIWSWGKLIIQLIEVDIDIQFMLKKIKKRKKKVTCGYFFRGKWGNQRSQLHHSNSQMIWK